MTCKISPLRIGVAFASIMATVACGSASGDEESQQTSAETDPLGGAIASCGTEHVTAPQASQQIAHTPNLVIAYYQPVAMSCVSQAGQSCVVSWTERVNCTYHPNGCGPAGCTSTFLGCVQEPNIQIVNGC